MDLDPLKPGGKQGAGRMVPIHFRTTGWRERIADEITFPLI